MITINLDKAKEIHKNKLRTARNPILSKLDIEFQRALETGANTASIVEQKQELRDITKHPDLLSATDIEEIKAFWPEILNG
jgi:hypothetical protein